MATFVSYDRRSGKIISVHHGSTDIQHAKLRAHEYSRADAAEIDVISVDPLTLVRGKRYIVDSLTKSLVETAGDDVGFSFGLAGSISTSPHVKSR